MRANKNLLALSVVLISLTGCAVQSEQEVEVSAPVMPVMLERVESKPERTSRDSTLAWDNIGRAGAAIHHPDYVHVLGGDGLATFQDSKRETKPSIKSTFDSLSSMRNGKGKVGAGYSMYELSRWERYCDSGKGMNEHDWRFVKKEGYDNAPLDALGGSCVRPAHIFEGYMGAWVRFCTSSPFLNANDRRIVGESTRPYSKVNPCQALLK